MPYTTPLHIISKSLRIDLAVSRIFKRHLYLHEYQCKNLLKQHGINTQRYVLIDQNKPTTEYIQKLNEFKQFVVKAQILAGGRGKGTFLDGFKGGVQLIEHRDEAISIANRMLNNILITRQTGKNGTLVNKVMIAEDLNIQHEKYLAVVLDNSSNGVILMGSPIGGVDIEEVAQNHPDQILKLPIDVNDPNIYSKAQQMSKFLQFDDKYIDECSDQIIRLYKLFNSVDATQIEINPFAIASNTDHVVCFDCKINIDDNAEFRQSQLFDIEDKSQLNKLEVRAKSRGLNYILMDGNIACIVNGAGLAMATMDLLNCYGGKAANFLDLGGRITVDGVIEALDIVLSDNKADRVFINIFGGIVNCTVIAKGISKFCATRPNIPLIVIRLVGNQADSAKTILTNECWNKNIFLMDDLNEAAKKICQ